jgi:hypothetical protein
MNPTAPPGQLNHAQYASQARPDRRRGRIGGYTRARLPVLTGGRARDVTPIGIEMFKTDGLAIAIAAAPLAL